MSKTIQALNSELVIHLQDLSVCYEIPKDPIKTFKEYVIRFLQGRIKSRKFWALSEINLNISKGEILGIIGNNGAGKSTLLKVISRILPPTMGRLQIKGNVSPMIEIGAGFHPELTGRENIFLNGTLLGHSKIEITEHMDGILRFAGIDNFIDAPLRTYSSGMVARLGFAVATEWMPEILILDEVLSVGDDEFRYKCQARMKTFFSKGTTILIVTHDMKSVQSLCTKAMWINQGRIKTIGPVEDVVACYQARLPDSLQDHC